MMTQDDVKRELIKLQIKKDIVRYEQMIENCGKIRNQLNEENKKLKTKMEQLKNPNDKNRLQKRYLQNCLTLYDNIKFQKSYEKDIIRFRQTPPILSAEETDRMLMSIRLHEDISDLLNN